MHEGHSHALQPSDFATADQYVAAVKALPDAPAHADDPVLAAEHAALFKLVPRSGATHVAIASGPWSSADTWWKGAVPNSTSKALIPEAITVGHASGHATGLYVRVDGCLDVTGGSLEIDTLVVDKPGCLEMSGDVDYRIAANGPINRTWDPLLLSRGIISHGLAIWKGDKKQTGISVAQVPAGATSITLDWEPDWSTDRVVVTSTSLSGMWYNGYKGTKDEVRRITAIEGRTITLDAPLSHEHKPMDPRFKVWVVNFTRSIRIRNAKEGLPTAERGHVMFMHSVPFVEYVEFDQLGRTDKAVRSVPATPTSDANVQGRYPCHLHQSGPDLTDAPGEVIGCTVFGSPGWGFVHHGAYAEFEDNASFDCLGAGFVAELGNETGAWRRNFSIKNRGFRWYHQSKKAEDVAAFDLARNGCGFWFQGRQVVADDNRAFGCSMYGFTYMHRGGEQVSAATVDQPEITRYRPIVDKDHVPIQHFRRNEAQSSTGGLEVIKANPEQQHDVRSVLDEFRACDVLEGLHLEYTAHYTVRRPIIVGTLSGPLYQSRATYGVELGTSNFESVVTEADIANAKKAIYASHATAGTAPSRFGYVFVGPHKFTNCLEGISGLDTTRGDISLSSPPSIKTPVLTLDPLIRFTDRSSGYSYRGVNGERMIWITGWKDDSLGRTRYEAEFERFRIEEVGIKNLLLHEGYRTLADGSRAVVSKEWHSDRLTAEIFLQLLTIPTADLSYPSAGNKGLVDPNASAPQAPPVSVSVAQGERITIPVQNLAGTTQPENGRVIEGPGLIGYRPRRGFVGQDTFNYWVSNGHTKVARGTVTVNVTAEQPQEPPSPTEPPPSEPEEPSMAVAATYRFIGQDGGSSALESGKSYAVAGWLLTIEAVTTNSKVKSVRLTLGSHSIVENVRPFSLWGDTSGKFTFKAFPAGSHSLKAEWYGSTGATGTKLDTHTINFTITEHVVEEPPPPPPPAEDPRDAEIAELKSQMADLTTQMNTTQSRLDAALAERQSIASMLERAI